MIGVVAAALVGAALPGVGATNATWRDSEWANAGLGTQNCATAANYATRGASKLIGGTILGTNLDAAASVVGPVVTNGTGGVVVTPAPPASQSLGSSAYADPLDVTALNTLNLQLGGLLTLPLNTSVGVVNQYAQAQTNGDSAGASGVVNNSGGISLTASPPSSAIPTFATLDLKTVLGTLGLGSVANLTDVQLLLGAVASSATLDACDAQWGSLYSNLQRKYVVAGLNAQVVSPLTSQLVSTVNTTTTGLTTTVNGLTSNTGLLSALASGVTSVLGTTLGGLGLGTPTVALSATVNFSALTTIFNQTISDPQGIVAINPAAGTISI
ncbi:MAG: hypothetical protein JWP75_2413, partial [Frondihabitans sp.]|nr:hypothetical protein [Frondihabitans sp.]